MTNAHADKKLTDEYSIVDYQATPSGYYQITFRGDDGTVTVTQEGRGGCNLYSMRTLAFDKWLANNAWLAVAFYRRTQFDWAVHAIENREVEWEDHVVMAICDMIDLKILTVRG